MTALRFYFVHHQTLFIGDAQPRDVGRLSFPSYKPGSPENADQLSLLAAFGDKASYAIRFPNDKPELWFDVSDAHIVGVLQKYGYEPIGQAA